MSLFNTDLIRLARQMVPAVLQMPRLRVWVDAVAMQMELLRQVLAVKRAEDQRELKRNGQVCRLEGTLNDVFDPVQRRIYIQDAFPADPLWLRRRAEAQPVFVYRRSETAVQVNLTRYVYTQPEILSRGFVVFVPVALTYDAARMRALVNKYRIPSSKFITLNY